jgi:hypothetical protein
MKIRRIICLLLLLFSIQSFGFNNKFNNYWVFGANASINFNSGSAVSIQGHPLVTYDNTATACDPNGNLLFTTNGVTIWDDQNTVMQNGTGLMGNTTGGQTALIVPVDNKLFYIFTVPEFGSSNGLRYSIVDIGLNNYHGGVTAKNVLLNTPSTEKLAAYYDEVNERFWIITHEYGNAKFNCFKLDENGLDTVPVTSTVGSANSGGSYGFDNGAMGQLVISQDGSHIANALELLGEIELFDFDIQTGQITNPINLSGFYRSWGLAFSPDGSKLYYTEWTLSDVYQFDLSVYTQNAIRGSMLHLGLATGSGGYNVGYLELAPDGKIYAARYGQHYLATIDDPNNAGLACNFSATGFNLGLSTSRAGLNTGPVFGNQFTSVHEITEKQIASTPFPNPATHSLSIQVDENLKKDTTFKLYNALGQLIPISFISEMNMVRLNVESLLKGKYYYLVSDKNSFSRGSVIVN